MNGTVFGNKEWSSLLEALALLPGISSTRAREEMSDAACLVIGSCLPIIERLCLGIQVALAEVLQSCNF